MEDVTSAMQTAKGNSSPSGDENFGTEMNEQATASDEVLFFSYSKEYFDIYFCLRQIPAYAYSLSFYISLVKLIFHTHLNYQVSTISLYLFHLG